MNVNSETPLSAESRNYPATIFGGILAKSERTLQHPRHHVSIKKTKKPKRNLVAKANLSIVVYDE